jgi:pimeloyl-ACP methyl ester carboxylesterase
MSEFLFLHWGPGANAAVERLWFRKTLPIEWWDQPLSFSHAEHAFAETVLAAKQQVLQLAEKSKKKVGLIAHSSGGQIAIELARLIPDQLCSLSLLSCNFAPARAFIELGSRLAPEHEFLSPLVVQAQARLDTKSFWPLLQAIASIPSFTDVYWRNTKAHARYLELAQTCPALDLNAFQAVMQNLLDRDAAQPGNSLARLGFPIDAYFGIYDPLQNIDYEMSRWKKVFPTAQMHRLECGHFPQFEIPIDHWFKIPATS